ncbi:RT0821/Lpp0805 family surface protein [Amorphus coralli]|uniref:RT0821/Lpp0805 family surface protein n=1 Tax=Amorphus coralli TaxID=340680 RepID=UPI00037949EE|nr:RT0821/Lpp0805 family surface protein [Amorphus coralli]
MYGGNAFARYIALRRPRHPAAAMAVAVCVALGGCGMFGPRTAMLAGNDVTGSVEPQVEQLAESSGLKEGDLAALALALGEDAAGPDTGRTWNNAAQGTGGRLVDVTDVPGPDGHLCRTFTTTVNAPTGLSLLSGIGCRRAGGVWVIDGLATGPGSVPEAAEG